MLRRRAAQRGVTLVELVIGLAIVGFVMLMGLPSFATWLQNSQIRTAAEAIQNGLQLARTEAVRQNTTVQFALGTGAGWTVGCVNASASCPAAIQSRIAAEGTSNAVVTPTAGQTTIVFNGMGRVTPVPAGTIDIDISNPTGGACAAAGPMRCLRVAVSAGGQIRMCDPVLASTDPRGC
ncbi:MAG: GspH/FimT family pseudopilin [Rhodocyclaceae bacterium]|nr:GspH/FimT family pseudopilin [Rhodocyclaceae bacterium]